MIQKTPEESKEALKCCGETPPNCKKCPYDIKDKIGCKGIAAVDALTYIQQLEAQVPKWISVEERLPKGGEMVIAKTLYFYEVLQWDARGDLWISAHSIHRKEYVTHWMPMSELPKEE